MAAPKLPRLITPERGLQNSSSAPELSMGRRPLPSSLVEEEDEEVEEGRGGAAQEHRLVPASAAAWLPALRPLTGCAGLGKVSAIDASLSTTARSLGVHSRQLMVDDPSSLPSTSRTRASLARGGQLHLRKAASDPSLRRSVALSRPSGRLMGCVSPDASRQNLLARQFSSMADGRRESTDASSPGPLSSSMGRLSMTGTVAGSDEQDFLKATERLDKFMAELKSGHDAFDPRQMGTKPLRLSTTGGAEKFADVAKNQTDEELERRAEKFEAYKMVRKLEPELPPLQRNLEQEAPPRTPPNQAIVMRNASAPALKCWSPSERRSRLGHQKDQRERRSLSVTSLREQMLQASCDRFEADLAQKRRKAESSLSDQKRGRMHEPAKLGAFGEQWISIIHVATFARNLRDRLVIEKTKPENGGQAAAVRSALEVVKICGEAAQFEGRLQLVCCMLKMRNNLQIVRDQAKVVHKSLTMWKTGGRICLTLQKVAHSVRHIQRWWRQGSSRLLEARHSISRRWERLERAGLLKEHARRLFEGPDSREGSAQGDSNARRRKRANSISKGLSADEYAMWKMLPEKSRLHFLEHELRARRYFVLPRLALWEKDREQWLQRTMQVVDGRCAMKFVQIQTDPYSMFNWPPMRPSCLPPMHPTVEAQGVACREDCCGRRGDDEILGMIKRAREHLERHHELGGWLEIPRRGDEASGSSAQGGGGVRKARSTGGRSRAQTEQANPFGDEVTDAEMREWGMDAEMPGLAEGAETPTPTSPC